MAVLVYHIAVTHALCLVVFIVRGLIAVCSVPQPCVSDAMLESFFSYLTPRYLRVIGFVLASTLKFVRRR